MVFVLCLFFVPAALTWITEKNPTNRRSGTRLAVKPARRDLRLERFGWQAWGAYTERVQCFSWGEK